MRTATWELTKQAHVQSLRSCRAGLSSARCVWTCVSRRCRIWLWTARKIRTGNVRDVLGNKLVRCLSHQNSTTEKIRLLRIFPIVRTVLAVHCLNLKEESAKGKHSASQPQSSRIRTPPSFLHTSAASPLTPLSSPPRSWAVHATHLKGIDIYSA